MSDQIKKNRRRVQHLYAPGIAGSAPRQRQTPPPWPRLLVDVLGTMHLGCLAPQQMALLCTVLSSSAPSHFGVQPGGRRG